MNKNNDVRTSGSIDLLSLCLLAYWRRMMKMPAPCDLSLLKNVPHMNQNDSHESENEDMSTGKTDVKILKTTRKERGSFCLIAVLLL